MNTKEVYDKLPASWDELKLKSFLKLTDLQIEETDDFDGILVGVDNSLKVIATLADVTVEELEALPIREITKIANKIAFISELPVADKSSIKWKAIDTVSFNDFIVFKTLAQEPIKNMPSIIKSFSKNELTDEQILDMSTTDAYAAFFLLLQSVKKSVRHMIASSSKTLLKQSLKQMLRIRKKSKV